jgi:hypothetical protein
MPRRPHNGSDWTSMPWWVRAIAVIGVPGVLTLYLVYSGVQEVPATRRASEQAVQEILRNREIMREHEIREQSNFRLLQRICINTAKTQDERNSCFD